MGKARSTQNNTKPESLEEYSAKKKKGFVAQRKKRAMHGGQESALRKKSLTNLKNRWVEVVDPDSSSHSSSSSESGSDSDSESEESSSD